MQVCFALPYGRMTYIRFQGSDLRPLSRYGSPSVFVPSERGHYITFRAFVNKASYLVLQSIEGQPCHSYSAQDTLPLQMLTQQY